MASWDCTQNISHIWFSDFLEQTSWRSPDSSARKPWVAPTPVVTQVPIAIKTPRSGYPKLIHERSRLATAQNLWTHHIGCFVWKRVTRHRGCYNGPVTPVYEGPPEEKTTTRHQHWKLLSTFWSHPVGIMSSTWEDVFLYVLLRHYCVKGVVRISVALHCAAGAHSQLKRSGFGFKGMKYFDTFQSRQKSSIPAKHTVAKCEDPISEDLWLGHWSGGERESCAVH